MAKHAALATVCRLASLEVSFELRDVHCEASQGQDLQHQRGESLASSDGLAGSDSTDSTDSNCSEVRRG